MSETWSLFRYRSINGFLWQELELAEFYCSLPTQLNDPFDCGVDWARSIERALGSSLDQKRRQSIELIHTGFLQGAPSYRGVGICCFSVKADDHLMWAHYADSHRGVCLYYEIPSDYFMDKYTPENDFFFVGQPSVTYGDDAFFDWLVSGNLDHPHAGDPHENALTRLFSSKAELWKHEEEVRLITSVPGRLTFEPDFLKQVIFGIGTPPEHRRLVTQAATRANSTVRLSEVTRFRGSDFGLAFPAIG